MQIFLCITETVVPHGERLMQITNELLSKPIEYAEKLTEYNLMADRDGKKQEQIVKDSYCQVACHYAYLAGREAEQGNWRQIKARLNDARVVLNEIGEELHDNLETVLVEKAWNSLSFEERQGEQTAYDRAVKDPLLV